MPCAKCGALWTEGVGTEELRAELKKRDDLEKKIREEFFKKEWPGRKHFTDFILLFPAVICGSVLMFMVLYHKEFEGLLTVYTASEMEGAVLISFFVLVLWLFLGAVIRHFKEKSVWKKYVMAYPQYANSETS